MLLEKFRDTKSDNILNANPLAGQPADLRQQFDRVVATEIYAADARAVEFYRGDFREARRRRMQRRRARP